MPDAQVRRLEELNTLISMVSGTSGLTGRAAKAQFSQFMLLWRKNLIGSQMTQTGVPLFETAYNGISDQAGPILVGLRSAAEQIKAKFTVLMNVGDPIVMQMVAGKSYSQLSDAIQLLDKRIDFYRRVSDGESIRQAAKNSGLPVGEAQGTTETRPAPQSGELRYIDVNSLQ